MLLSRIIVAIVFIPLLLTIALVRGPLLLAAVIVTTTIACAELALMFRQRGLSLPLPAVVLVGWAYLWWAQTGRDLLLPLGGAALVTLAWVLLQRDSLQQRASAFVLTVLGGSYIGFCTSFALLLAHLPLGHFWLVLVLLGDWGADAGGYFVGRRFGRRRLAPLLSPSKTWEGVVGALVTPVAAVALMMLLLPIPAMHVIPLGLALGVSAVVGDLAESAVKRQAGVKDASRLLGGHGGFLDRMDSLFLVLPVVYLYAVNFAG